MQDELAKLLKEKIIEYITGQSSAKDLLQWALTREEMRSKASKIRNGSDIVFLLVEQAGLDVKNFYIKERINIPARGLIRNIERTVKGEMTPSELYNWADDVFNWELIEGFEGDLVKNTVKHLSASEKRLEELTKEDYRLIMTHLNDSENKDLCIKRIGLIFSLPVIRTVLNKSESSAEALRKLDRIRDNFANEKNYSEILGIIKVLLGRQKSPSQIDEMLRKVALSHSSGDFLKDLNS